MISKKAKAAYDKKYRKKNAARIKAIQAAYFHRTYDPVKAAKERKERMPYHVKYCRQRWYKKWKRGYDKRHRAARFGAFAEAYEVLKQLRKEINKQMPNRFDRYAQSGRGPWNPINQARYRKKRAAEAEW